MGRAYGMDTMERVYTLEEVNAFRAEVHRILMAWGKSKDFADSICGYNRIIIRGNQYEPDRPGTESDIIRIWRNDILPYNTPESYADLMTL